MSELKFRFYPPKKQQDINLVPNSTIVGASALVARSTAAKKKKIMGIRDKMLPPFGPTQAIAMGSDLAGNLGGDSLEPGYGNSNYGTKAYGESLDIIKRSNIRKSYTLYSNHLQLCESFD